MHLNLMPINPEAHFGVSDLSVAVVTNQASRQLFWRECTSGVLHRDGDLCCRHYESLGLDLPARRLLLGLPSHNKLAILEFIQPLPMSPDLTLHPFKGLSLIQGLWCVKH